MKKKIYPAVLATILSCSITMQSFAAAWVQVDTDWYVVDGNENHLKDLWYQDTDENWYYLDAEGKMETGWKTDPAGNLFYLNPNDGDPKGTMVVGWKLINSSWYFFNTAHDGYYGRVLTGWQWIDGYCYCFGTDGKMYANTTTQDGYTVDDNGAWTDDGSPIYVKGKGIITTVSTISSSGKTSSGSSGGGGGGGSRNSSTTKTYSYTVECVDKSTSNVIATYSLTAKKGSTITLDYSFDNYELVPGQETTVPVSVNDLTFVLYYENNIMLPEEEYYSYTIVCRDIDTAQKLETKTYKGLKDDEIQIGYPEIDGYELYGDQFDTFILDTDNKTVTVFYKVKENITNNYSFVIQYLNSDDDTLLGEKTGVTKANSTITVDFPAFDGYEVKSGQQQSHEISEDGMEIAIYYDKAEKKQVATPSEPEKTKYAYTVICHDFEDGSVIGSYTDKAEADKTITIHYGITGYTVCEAYSFAVNEDNLVFDIHYTKDSTEKKYSYSINQIDITTRERISKLVYTGIPGETIDLSNLRLDGYELLGNPPDSIKISSVESNNELNLYYKKLSEYMADPAVVSFTVEFVDYSDHENKILNDVYGSGCVGDEIPIYFYEAITTSNGNTWKSVGTSPRLFELVSTDYNVFTIEYRNTSEAVAAEELMQYSIRYLAEDTGATLGISAGYAEVGTKISYRNNLGTTEYGIADSSATKLTISNTAEENHIEVLYARVSFPSPGTNSVTGKYDGNNWTIVFVDNEGTHLLESMSGFSLAGTALIIDYPDEFELNGYTYRAKSSSPYREVQEGTIYRQIAIEYTKGDNSSNKLATWKQAAQEAKDEIFGTSPLSYYVTYKEANSWNDIGLRLGVSQKNSYVTISIPDIPDYVAPAEKIEGFTLTEDGAAKTVGYTRFSSGTSISSIKTSYQIYFQDEDGNDLFESYSGYVASETDESKTNFPVYYPISFTDKEGNLWEADETSPANLVIDTLSQNGNTNVITFHKIFENPKNDMVVTNNTEALGIFGNITSRIADSSEKIFYLIGEGYSPNHMNPATIMSTYNLVNYSNEIVDTFVVDGTAYYVSEIHVSRTWEESNCVHHWNIIRSTTKSCLVNGSETLACDKCGKTVTTIVPAVGHIDQNHDSVCDTCDIRAFSQILGDEISVDFDSGDGTYTYTFVCIDNDYDGTGKMLYICEDNIPSAVYGNYSSNHQVRFEDSLLRSYLNDTFANGLSVKAALNPMGLNRVTLLTKDEADMYKSQSENKYLFPSGTYLTQSTNSSEDMVLLSDGTEVTPADASNYGVKPVILLERPIAAEAPSYTWRIGDMHSRKIAGELYLFRCISESYKDKTNTAKTLALFICDTVVPANIIDDATTDMIETMFFGERNNYKYSTINRWLDENCTDALSDTTTINIGVNTAYSGKTQTNGYSNLNEQLLTRYALSTQYMESNLFVLSVEEAIQYKNYLWKFNGSDSDNASEAIRQYCHSYWLRTPEYDTTDRVYVVNLENGRIETRTVSSTANNDYSETGIRPVYAVTQYE